MRNGNTPKVFKFKIAHMETMIIGSVGCRQNIVPT